MCGRKLTHGSVSQVTQSGRVAATWPGVLAALRDGLRGGACTNVVNRDGTTHFMRSCTNTLLTAEKL